MMDRFSMLWISYSQLDHEMLHTNLAAEILLVIMKLWPDDDFVAFIAVDFLFLIDLQFDWLHWSCYYYFVLLFIWICFFRFGFRLIIFLLLWSWLTFNWLFLFFYDLWAIVSVYVSIAITVLDFLWRFFNFWFLCFSFQHFAKLLLNFLDDFDLMTSFDSHLIQFFLCHICVITISYISVLPNQWFPLH